MTLVVIERQDIALILQLLVLASTAMIILLLGLKDINEFAEQFTLCLSFVFSFNLVTFYLYLKKYDSSR